MEKHFCSYCGHNTKKIDHSCRPMRGQQLLEDKIDLLKTLLKDYSILEIETNAEKLLGCKTTGRVIRTICIKNGISLPTCSDAKKKSRAIMHTKNSLQERYGVDNPSKSNVVKQRKIDTTTERYGVINPFQLQSVKDASKKTLMQKYGVEYPCELPRKNSSGFLSKPHQIISSFLEAECISHENEVVQ